MIKQVIVIRKDLKMRRGKEIAQGAHASMMYLAHNLKVYDGLATKEEQSWLKNSMAKICLQVDSEAALMEIYNKAKIEGLTVHVVTDEGRTEFNGVPTKTCLAIGPDEELKIDAITSELKLY